MTQIVNKEQIELFSPEDVKVIKQFKDLEVRYKEICAEKRQQLIDYMKSTGVLSFRTDDLIVSYKGPYTKKTVDTSKMKEQGIYDNFLKESQVAESVSISVKYDD